MKKVISLFAFIVWTAIAKPADHFSTKDYVLALKKVTDIMVNDATSPVAAGRYYAYVTLAANEMQSLFYPNAFSFSGKLNQYKGIKAQQETISKADPTLSVIYTLLRMGERLLPSGYLLKSQADSLLQVARQKGILKENIDSSKKLTETVVQQIMEWVQADGFRNLSGYKKYTPVTGDGAWQPTAPIFMQALEPYWNKVRTILLDSCSQFKPLPPANFDTAKTSEFCKQMYDVYNTGKTLSKEQKAIAMFWDCNPFAVQQMGHVEFALKKISPGGHWLGITGIACLKKKKSLQQAVFIHALVAATLHDAFISCWDEKYRSNRIRPETAINKWIDPRWRPLLQTPPFPEYSSGHSVISTASAAILTKLFGDNFQFTDNTENEFGLPSRKFSSFRAAANEAAMSRLYGGIHYRDAIENGQQQGQKIAEFIIQKLKL
jgi:hypothetical protein